MSHHRMLERIQAEFLEMPGLHLTLDQAQRLCGVERALCKAVLDALVDVKFLCVKANGAYARLTDGRVPHLRQAKTQLDVNRHVVAAS